MLTMIDQIFDRNYQGARHAMNADATHLLQRFFESASAAFKALNRIEYSAPWAVRRSACKPVC
ncbi:MAG: hypothetical protein ABIO68_05785 [Sphingomicrobium sp.]